MIKDRTVELEEKIDPNTVFDKDDATSADFEIAFSALVATAVLSFPTNSLSFQFIKIASIGLIFITVLRRMAVLSTYARTRRITESTTAVLLLLTYLCFLYLLEKLATAISVYLPEIISPVMVMGVLVSITFLLFIIVQEFAFRDLLLYASVSAYNSGVSSENSIYQEKFLQLAVTAAKASLATEKLPPSINWMRYTDIQVPEGPSTADRLGYYLGVALVLLLFVTLWVASVFVLGESISTIIVLAATLILSILVKFLYERYGLTPLISDRRTATDASALAFGFLIAVWLFV